MPRGATSRRATRDRDSNRNAETEVKTVTTTATVETEDTVRDDLPFELNITPAEDGYKPDRSPAGRKRIPSPFETVLPDLKGKGWMNQPHDGDVVAENQEDIDKAIANGLEPPTAKYNTTTSVKDSDARIILRELSKAVKFLNSPDGGDHNLGLDVNVTASLVQFNVRDKQKRKPRTAPGGGDVSDGETDDVDSDVDADSSGDE